MNKWIRTTIYCLAALTLLWILVIVADRQIDSHDLPGDPNCVAIYQLEDELNEPNEDDLENARKLGNLLINYADYAQGKIDCNEYVRRGTLKEQAWNWSEPNDQTIYYHRVEECESRGCFEDIAAPKGTALPASEGELYWQEIKDKKDKLFIYTDSHGWVEVKDLHIYEPNLSETTYYHRVDEANESDIDTDKMPLLSIIDFDWKLTPFEELDHEISIVVSAGYITSEIQYDPNARTIYCSTSAEDFVKATYLAFSKAEEPNFAINVEFKENQK